MIKPEVIHQVYLVIVQKAFPVCIALFLAISSLDSVAESSEMVVAVQVEDRDEQVIDAAASEALLRLLMQTSGDPDISKKPDILAALRSARNLLSLYRFELVGGQLTFFAQFERNEIEALLRQSRSSYWTSNPPPIMFWLVIDDVEGRRFGNTFNEQPIWQRLSDDFEALGVNLRRPLYDLADSHLVTPDVLWDRDLGPILEGSERYGMNHILIGRLVKLSKGRFIGDWNYFHADTQLSENIEADSLRDIVIPAVNLAVKEMKSLYAINLVPVSDKTSLGITVRNVVSLDDYLGVLTAINKIRTLKHYRTESVMGGNLRLRLFGIPDGHTLFRLMVDIEELQGISGPVDGLNEIVLGWQGY